MAMVVSKFVEQPESNTHNRLQDLTAKGLVLRIEEDWRVYYDLPETPTTATTLTTSK